MRKLWLGLVIVSLGGLTGCPSKSTTGSGTTGTYKIKLSDDSFTLKQGEEKAITITVTDRSKDFKEDVKVTLTLDDESGLEADPSSVTIKPSEDKKDVIIKATKKAGIKKHDVKVKATAGSGSPVESTATVTVEKKADE
jgi:hypothetical protein